MEVFPGITMHQDVRFGKLCVKGTRVDVASVLESLAKGESFNTVQEDYQLSSNQILDVLRYDSYLAI
jgi:uncharacterized protein (DUF433 family)